MSNGYTDDGSSRRGDASNDGDTAEFVDYLNKEMYQEQRKLRLAFTGVTARAFPLKASLNRLQDFCDSYLNFADDTGRRPPYYFKPAIPFVYLQMINYGEMATLTENLGFISQHEVLFAVPVEWYDVDRNTGKLKFRDWALVCPYVFVDNDMSLRTGRQVYGWTKVRAWLNRVEPSWTDDPRNRRQLMELKTKLFLTAYSGQRIEPRVLLEIVQDPPPSVFRNPYSKRDLFNPLWTWPQAVRESMMAVGDTLEFLTALPILGYDQARFAPVLPEMMRRGIDNTRRFLPWVSCRDPYQKEVLERAKHNPYINQITLKQFRDAAEPTLACYQAYVNSKILIDHYHDGGLLGGPNLFLGDLTAGFRVLVHDYAEQKIVHTLGIEISETEKDAHGKDVLVLTPRLPFWTSLDLRYDEGELLHWRSKTSDWTQGKETQAVARGEQRNCFNVTRGAAIQELFGPFNFPDITVRVLPLAAKTDQLQRFCDRYLNNLIQDKSAEGRVADLPRSQTDIDRMFKSQRFTPWGDHVFLLVTSYGGKHGAGYSESNDIGQIEQEKVSFYVPAEWTFEDDQGAKRKRPCLLAPWVFNSSSRHAITEREVNGVEAHHAVIHCDDASWLKESGPVAERLLMSLKRLMMIGANAGQEADMRTLIEIRQDGQYPAHGRRRDAHRDEECPDIKDMIRYLGSSVDFVSLKQFPKSGNFDNSCYQAFVMVKRRITHIFDHRRDRMRESYAEGDRFKFAVAEPMGDDLRVSIQRHLYWPIVENLGLRYETLDCKPGELPVYQIRPERPFFLRLGLREEVGMNLWTRTHGTKWQREQQGIEELHRDVTFPTATPMQMIHSMLNCLEELGSDD